ncbi:MAG: PIN domain-containing protein [Gemmataceae bacterium]
MKQIFVDTSAWLAYANRRDPDHTRVRRAFRAAKERFVTSNFVFDEVITFCQKRFGHKATVQLGTVLRDAKVVELVRLTFQDEEDAWNLLIDRPDKDYSFTDCTSFGLMRRLGITKALSLDADFRQEGFDVAP